MRTELTSKASVKAHQPVEQNPQRSSDMRIEQAEEEEQKQQQQVVEEEKDVQQIEIEDDGRELEKVVNEQEVNFENRAVPESLQERQ